MPLIAVSEPKPAAGVSILGPAALQIISMSCISMYTIRVNFRASPFRYLGFWNCFFISTLSVKDSIYQIWTAPRLGLAGSTSEQRRGTFELVSTCIETIFLCTWTAAHHDVFIAGEPYPSSHKVMWMFGAILASKLVTAWALYQYFEARSCTLWMSQESTP